jgi:hypothetical protein
MHAGLQGNSKIGIEVSMFDMWEMATMIIFHWHELYKAYNVQQNYFGKYVY